MVYLVGDLSSGFEVVSVRYRGVGPGASYDDLDVRAGAVDFRRREVFRIDESYLFATQAERFIRASRRIVLRCRPGKSRQGRLRLLPDLLARFGP